MANDFRHLIAKAEQGLELAVKKGQIRAASYYVRDRSKIYKSSFGDAASIDAVFLLGSISKPIVIASLMVLFDRGKFRLEDPVKKYLPEFTGGGRDSVTIQHLLTHVSGLPDQLPNNADLRAAHAPLAAFVQGATGVPLDFLPGTQYQYSSMAIMLAAEIAQRLSGTEIREWVSASVLQPLEMSKSALGMGKLNASEIMLTQVEFGAVESGGGSAESKAWDWNSNYWRNLGAPWGGLQASAIDVGRFLESFMSLRGQVLKSSTASLMIQNHNPVQLPPRGLGFDLKMNSICKHCSAHTFGHTGSTGTLAWADPHRERVCVVLTTLPASALPAAKHPRTVFSEAISRELP